MLYIIMLREFFCFLGIEKVKLYRYKTKRKRKKMPNCIKMLYSFRRIISFTVQRLRFTVVVQIRRAKCVLGSGGKMENTNFWGNCKPNFQTLYVATKIHADYIRL